MKNQGYFNYFKYYEEFMEKTPFNNPLTSDMFTNIIKKNNELYEEIYDKLISDISKIAKKNMKSMNEMNEIITKLMTDTTQSTEEKLSFIKELSDSSIAQANEQVEFVNQSRKDIYESISKRNFEIFNDLVPKEKKTADKDSSSVKDLVQAKKV